MVISGAGTSIGRVVLFTNITHTYASDLDITLTSPAGTVVTVTTDNGAGNDNTFAGTSWDPSSTNAPSDYVFANLVVAPLLATEGSFDNFLGQDPNGTWTLTIADDAGGDHGLLNQWDLTISTCGCSSAVANYCTSSTTTNLCNPVMSASNTTASIAAGPGSFVLTCNQVEGAKFGLVFYGIAGQNGASWGVGGTSFLCVKSPTQRTPSVNSGGTGGLCDGVLSVDFFAYMAGNPTALGQPIAAGQVYDAQTWFRDPPAVKTTNLSDGIEFTLCP